MSWIRRWTRLTHFWGPRLLLAALASGALMWGLTASAAATNRPPRGANPVLFVHGFESSGGQFSSQRMRFESNGYPTSWIEEIDYDSTAATANMTQVDEQIDAAIALLKQRTGKAQVDVIGHSEGTSVMYGYLAEGEKAAARRANVAKYINQDGQENNPGVPTLAEWAERSGPTGPTGRHMVGAQNVTLPDQTHVQSATSSQSFELMFQFFTGKAPAHDIVPVTQKKTNKKPIEIAGKAISFPVNNGDIGATVQIWAVDEMGYRYITGPLSKPIELPITNGGQGGGEWGPVTVNSYQRYEFAVVQAGQQTVHVYKEPFVRSDYAIRLLTSLPIQEASGNRKGSSGGVMIRYEEMWGDEPGQNDEVLVNGLNVCTAALCPWKKLVNAYFAVNWENKEESTLKEDPGLSSLPFIQAAQVYVPSEPDPPTSGKVVSWQLKSRKGGGLRTLDTPPWESTSDQIEIQWNDFESLNF